MEKGKGRAAAAIWSAILLVTVCMGCGNRKEPDKPVVEDSGKEAVVWVPEYKTLEQVFRMQAACGTEDDFVPSMAVNREDQIFLTDAAGGIKIYNQELQEVSSIALPAKVQPWGVGICKEGEAVCLGYGSDSDLAELYVLDADAGNVAKVCRKNIPDERGGAEGKFGRERNTIASGREQGILLKTASGLVEYDPETETAVSVLSWEDSNIDVKQADLFTVLADGRILISARRF